jgi:hypothetical protein
VAFPDPGGANAVRGSGWPARPEDDFHPILSSVDNAWLAVGLKIVARRVAQLARGAAALYEAMDLGFYYVPERNRVLFHFRPGDRRTRRAATTRSSVRATSSTTSE